MDGLNIKEKILIILFVIFWVAVQFTILLPLSLIWCITRSEKLHYILFDKPVGIFCNWLVK